MNTGLWKKNLRDSMWLLASCAALMLVFHWLRVWLAGQLPLASLRTILDLLPPIAEKVSPVPLSQIATPAGRIAIAYDDPLVMLTASAWAIARGSDAVSGELGRGTMEMLLAQPVSRLAVLWTQAATTLGGAVLIALAAWLGTVVGLATVELDEPVGARLFLPAAMNLAALTIFLAGLTTACSSLDQYRWRTIGLVGGFYAVELAIKMFARAAPGLNWLRYFSFFTAYEPQLIVSRPDYAWSLWAPAVNDSWQLGGLGYDSILIGMGLVGYAAAAVIFCSRDLPAPL